MTEYYNFLLFNLLFFYKIIKNSVYFERLTFFNLKILKFFTYLKTDRLIDSLWIYKFQKILLFFDI